MSQKLRTKIPIASYNLQAATPNTERLQQKGEKVGLNMKLYFDSHHAAKQLPVLQSNDEVCIKDRQETRKVQQQVNNHSRSYLFSTPSDNFRRNRVQLTKMPTIIIIIIIDTGCNGAGVCLCTRQYQGLYLQQPHQMMDRDLTQAQI